MTNVFNAPDDAFFQQILGDKLVVRPNLTPLIDAIEIVTVVVNDVERFNSVRLAQSKVILTIGWRHMDNPRT